MDRVSLLRCVVAAGPHNVVVPEGVIYAVSSGRLIVAEKSAHYINGGQPDLVIDAVRQVVEAARDPGSWASATPEGATPAP